ncbi:flagellar hook-length control protein FliK [Bacillus gobiensis]|uniref:flagellar hook-length control protein FliK n=1 Tax=Bacillus gobiensis TaxID=1441095 RepID=UPI003D25396D
MDEIKLLDVVLSNARNGQKTSDSSRSSPELFQQLLSAQIGGQIAQEPAIENIAEQKFQDLGKMLSFLLNGNRIQPDQLQEVSRTKDSLSTETNHSYCAMPNIFHKLSALDEKSQQQLESEAGFTEKSENLEQLLTSLSQHDFQVLSRLFERLAESPELLGIQALPCKDTRTEEQPLMQPFEPNTRTADNIRQDNEVISGLNESWEENQDNTIRAMSGDTSGALGQLFQQVAMPDISQQDVKQLSQLFADLADLQIKPEHLENQFIQPMKQQSNPIKGNIRMEAKAFLQIFSSFFKHIIRSDSAGISSENGFSEKRIQADGQPFLRSEQAVQEVQQPDTLTKTTSESNEKASAADSSLRELKLKSSEVQLSQSETDVIAKLLSSINGEKKETEWKTNTASQAVLLDEKSEGKASKLPLSFPLNHQFLGKSGTAEIGKHAEIKPKAGDLDESQVQPVLQMNKSAEVQQAEPISPEKQKPVLPDQIIVAWKKAKFTPFGKMTGSFTVRLHPEHLGHLTVKINNKHGLMTGRIIASSDSAKELLEHHLPLLKQALPNMPMQIERFSVPLQDVSHLQLNQHNGEGERHSRQREHKRSEDEENEPFQQFLDEMKIEAVAEDRREQQ